MKTSEVIAAVSIYWSGTSILEDQNACFPGMNIRLTNFQAFKEWFYY